MRQKRWRRREVDNSILVHIAAVCPSNYWSSYLFLGDRNYLYQRRLGLFQERFGEMITFRKQTLWERVLLRISPTYKRKHDERMRAVLRYLLDNPDMPCKIEGEISPNGRGSD